MYFALNFGGTAIDLNQGSTYTQSQMLSFAEIAQSPLVLNPVIDELKLNTTAAELANAIGVSTPQNTAILQLSVTDPNPQKAADISNAIAASLGTTVSQIAPKGVNNSTTVSARTIQHASVPLAPSSPNLRLNIVAGLVLGLILGFLILVLKELLDTRVHNAEAATEVAGVPLLGSIQRESRKAVGPVLARDPLSNAAENFRQLRSNLGFVAVDSNTFGFVVTSSIPGEGKSLIATNLAMAYAESDQRVLLIDADLRRPTIAKNTGLVGSAGLTSLLVGRASLEDVVQRWGTGQLDVLTSGPIPPNPSELLSSRAMADLLAAAMDDYDVVIVDTAPTAAAADASILARLVDGAVVVVDRTATHRAQLAQAMDSLEKSGVSVLGLVLNRVAPRKDRHAYYYTAIEEPKPRRSFGLGRGRIGGRSVAAAAVPPGVKGSSSRPERHAHVDADGAAHVGGGGDAHASADAGARSDSDARSDAEADSPADAKALPKPNAAAVASAGADADAEAEADAEADFRAAAGSR
jgi:capsular exopolysaccharide synthesis family protein